MLTDWFLLRRYRYPKGRKEGWKKGREEGRQEGLREGRKEVDAVWSAWHQRMLDAQSRGEPFNEPPPKVEEQDQQNANDIRQLTKQIPPIWVTPLITSLLVGAIVLAITLATR